MEWKKKISFSERSKLQLHILLQKREKWQNELPSLQIGDVVIVRNANAPPTYWPLARVIALKPSRDGLVRDVTVKTAKSTFDRPITQLCKIPVDSDNL